MAQSDPAPVSQDDDSCDKLFKLKHCREKLHDQYYGLVYRVWQWNNLEEGLSSVMELVNHSESGNDEHLKDSSKKKRESLEEMMANWERSFDEKINDEEFSALFAKCKEVLTNLKETLNNDDVSLTPIQNKIRELIVLANIQRQYLSKQCGNVETHKVCSALQNLCKLFSSKTQDQGLTESDSKPADKQSEKKKKGKDTASSVHSDLKQIVDFVCQKQSFVQKLGKIFPPEGTENIRVPNDVIQWAKACVEAHGALVELSSIKELEKTTELYKTVKELFDNECAKVEAQQKIEKIMEGFTANFADFFAKVMLLIGEIDEYLQGKKKPQDSTKKLKKTLEDAKDRLIQKMEICLPDTSISPQNHLQIMEELSHILTDGQLFSMLTECHKKVNYLREERINLEKQLDLTEEARKEKEQNCEKILENCSNSLRDFIKSIKEDEIVTCMQCKRAMECRNVNQALREGKLTVGIKRYIRSSLHAAYSSKEWQETRMLKQVVDSLKNGQELEPEPRKYLIDLLSKWHEDCTICKEAESCKIAKKALERVKSAYLFPEERRFILRTLKEFREESLYEEALVVFTKGPEVEGKLQQSLLEIVTEWYKNFRERGSFEGMVGTVDAEHQTCVSIYEAYEAVKSHRGKGSFPDSVRTFLLEEALSDPSEYECCKKILHLSKAFDVLENDDLTGEQIKYLLEMFPATATCKRCSAMETHEKNDESEKYWEQLHQYLEKQTECENCQDMLQCMDVYKILSSNKELREDDKTKVIALLHKFEDEWNCGEKTNCIQAIQVLSDDTAKHREDVKKYVMEKLKERNPCEVKSSVVPISISSQFVSVVMQELIAKSILRILEDKKLSVLCSLHDSMHQCTQPWAALEYDQYVLHESHEAPSREYLRDFLLKNSCESCSILMEQFKVRKTLQENKYLANNLCDTICEDFFPKTIQCKECHQWVDCMKMLDITETLSENHMKSVYHILDSTAGCKDCTCYDKDTDNSSLRKIVSSESVAAKSRIMDAIKDRWDRALKCKVCHTKLIHLKIPQSEGNTEEKDRLKTFIRNYLKQFEFRLQCEVCEGFFVPKNPIVLEQLPLGALKISTSGCSKAEDVKKFQQAASDQLKEHVGSLEDTFVYPSENKSRKRYSSGNVKPREAAAGEATKCETSSDEVTSNVGDVKPTLLPASDQLKVQGDCCLEGELCDKRRNHGSGKSQQGGISGECSRDEDWMRQISKPDVDEDTTRSEPCLTQSMSKSAPPDGDEDEVLPPKYARCYSKDDLDESEGIAEAVGILQEWGKAHNVSLCILKNYGYGNLEGILKEFRSTITKSSGDFDILVLSRHLGVILVEMKATQFKSKKQLKRALRKAQDQLNKNKMVLFEINKDWLCPPRVPVISLIAVPNITCQQLQDNGICQRDRQRILSKCMIEFLKTKPKELDKVIGIPNFNYAFNDYEYYTLMARFLSLNNLIKYHCTDEGLIRDTGKKMLGMLLTEAQKSLIQSGGNPFQILAGDYGTGKSLMLTEKAKVIANAYKNLLQKKKIMLISCTDITVDGKYLNKGQPKDSVEHLRNFIGESATEREFNYFDHIEFHMIRSFINGHSGEDVVEKLEAAIAACVSSEDTELHLLFDEMPLKFMRMFKPKIESLLTTYKSVIKTFWVSIATHSFRVTVLSKQDPEWIKDDRPADFEFRYLRKNLRVPGRVLDLQKAIEWFNGDGHVDTRRGDIPLGPMPLLYRVPKCVCPSQSNSILTCECSKFRVKETLRRLFIKIGFLQEQPGKSVQSEKVGPCSITMLLFAVESQSFRHDVCKVLSESCKELLIHVEDRTYIRPDGNGRSEESSSGHYTGSDGEEFITGNEGSSNLHSHTADGKKWCSASSPGLGHCQTSSNHKDIKNEGLHREESHSNQKIVLTTETSFIGCESEVLICVDLNGMLHWYPNSKLAYTTSGISRCLSQYIHLTWMPSEAEKMFREQMEVLIQDGDAEREDIERAFRCKETCLERVLNQILIEEQMVDMPKFVQE